MHSVQKLYQNYGKFFYAAAATDKVVSTGKRKTLKKSVKRDWVDVNNFEEEFGTADVA